MRAAGLMRGARLMRHPAIASAGVWLMNWERAKLRSGELPIWQDAASVRISLQLPCQISSLCTLVIGKLTGGTRCLAYRHSVLSWGGSLHPVKAGGHGDAMSLCL